LPDAAAWTRYQGLGLRRVTFGLAFGTVSDPALPITPPDVLRRLIAGARAAHIAVSLLIWPGAIAPSAEARERDQAVALISSLALGRGDHVYTVEDDEAAGPTTALRAALAPLRQGLGVKVLPYSLKKQGL
jgi:hypothetical protein